MNYMREKIFLALANHLPLIPMFDRIRVRIFRIAGMKIKDECRIWGPITVRPTGGAKHIEIGKDSFLSTDIQFGAPKDKVVIGENVQIGPCVMFETAHHDLKDVRKIYTKPIVIEDNVWIAAGAIITGGVTVGRGAIIAAGAVVTEDVKASTLAGGVPAKLIRNLDS